ncbi:hypothetical protein [Pseudomonas sp. RL_5y_Pfl2_73]|uniref:hypothetical protein n=1 Tax=Pseudomonas sp. RL_5y_Pfl2_73 TaxID=3088713 RepID=UPI0030DB579F
MVKVGFIVEGDSEKIVIESADFKAFLQANDFELVNPVVNGSMPRVAAIYCRKISMLIWHVWISKR